MCNTPGLGGGSQSSTGQAGSFLTPSNPRQDLAQRNFLTSLIGSDWTKGGGGLIGDIRARASTPFQYSTPFLSERGLTQEQERAFQTPFQQAVTEAVGKFSANYANKGFNRPENINAIVGSAAMNVAPRFAELFANLAGQNVNQRTQAPLVEEEVTRNRFNDLLQSLGLLGGTLQGSTQLSSGTQNSNFIGSTTNALIGAVGQAKSGSTITTNNY